MSAWYNEVDPFKAAWLRELVKAGHIAPGIVDERSIKDVGAAELMGYTQCHFFAGIGIWSLALRNAGWPDDRPVWTGSCPCPSFSAAGKGGGFDDPRHLWPAWEKLIRECRPAVIFGEQADDAVGYGWLDLVQTDLETQAYAVGKIVLGTCSVGGADIRQRLYFMAQSESERSGTRLRDQRPGLEWRHQHRNGSSPLILGNPTLRGCGISGDASQPGSGGHAAPAGESCELAHPNGRQPRHGGLQRSGEHGLEPEDGGAGCMANGDESGCRARIENDDARQPDHEGSCGPERVADTVGSRCGGRPSDEIRGAQERDAAAGRSKDGFLDHTFPLGRAARGHDDREHERLILDATGNARRSSPLNGPWRDADWLLCRDGKWRPVESGTFPLAHGDPCRLGRLRGYGDAINAEVARAFIEAYLDLEKGP